MMGVEVISYAIAIARNEAYSSESGRSPRPIEAHIVYYRNPFFIREGSVIYRSSVDVLFLFSQKKKNQKEKSQLGSVAMNL